MGSGVSCLFLGLFSFHLVALSSLDVRFFSPCLVVLCFMLFDCLLLDLEERVEVGCERVEGEDTGQVVLHERISYFQF